MGFFIENGTATRDNPAGATSAVTTPTPTTSAITSTIPTPSSPSSSPFSSGLSAGASAGIGIGVGLGAAALLVGAFVVYKKKRSSRNARIHSRRNEAYEQPRMPPKERPELRELSNDREVAEMGSDGNPKHQAFELP